MNEGLGRGGYPQANAVVPLLPKRLAPDPEVEDVETETAHPDVAVAGYVAVAIVRTGDVEDGTLGAVGCADDVLDVAVHLGDEFLAVADEVGAVHSSEGPWLDLVLVTDLASSGPLSTGLHGRKTILVHYHMNYVRVSHTLEALL